jgi:hypothetical protein
MPAPLNAKVIALPPPTRVTVIVAASLAKVEGVNVTVMLQLFPAPIVLELTGQVPPQAKSAALEPRIVMLERVIEVLRVFLTVAVFAALAS